MRSCCAQRSAPTNFDHDCRQSCICTYELSAFLSRISFAFIPPCPLHNSQPSSNTFPPKSVPTTCPPSNNPFFSSGRMACARNVSNLFSARPSISPTNFWLTSRSFFQLRTCVHSRRSLYTQRSTRYVANTGGGVLWRAWVDTSTQSTESWCTAFLQNAAPRWVWRMTSSQTPPWALVVTLMGQPTPGYLAAVGGKQWVRASGCKWSWPAR